MTKPAVITAPAASRLECSERGVLAVVAERDRLRKAALPCHGEPGVT